MNRPSPTPLEEVLRTLTLKRPRAFSRRRLRLHVLTGRDVGAHHEFTEHVRLGTRPLADLVLADPAVSGLHCEIVVGTELRLRDLGSKNGTFLGGYRVLEAVPRPGDVVRLGETEVRLVATDDSVEVPLNESDQYMGIVGQSAAMRALTARIERLAHSQSTVLVSGATGVGKEKVVEALHLGGARADGPLVVIDCSALPATLIESELFGHERGAFTGASARVIGAFERASGGTLFLDEIGELPLELQPKLLRALESRTVRRLGGAQPVPFDARIVAATHRDLALEAQRGRFREDLYYRLAVVLLRVPPLRERLEDVPLLAAHLLRQLGCDPATHLTVESLATLAAYDWPGNVRELRNTLERAVALAADAAPLVLDPLASAPPASPPVSPAIDLAVPLRAGKQRVIEDYERAYISALLAETKGNISEAARRAGMDRISIHRLLQRLGRPGT